MIAHTLPPEEVRAVLQEAVTAAGGAEAWGQQHQASAKLVNGVLSGERLVPSWFYPALRLRVRKIVVREPAK